MNDLASDPLHVLFAGGGTVGHLMPGLAVAQRLARLVPKAHMTFVGTGKPRERDLVEAAGHTYHHLPCAPGTRKWTRLAPCVWNNLRGLAGALGMLGHRQFDVVVGLGGYASLPAAQAAAWLGIPLVLLEQNAVPGRATRWLAPRAQAVCVAFEETRRALPESSRTLVTGNPVRRECLTARRRREPKGEYRVSRRQLVILGGSGGARALNQALPVALAAQADRLAGWHIVHQTGPDDLESTCEAYHAHRIAAEVRPFIHEMPDLLAHSDLAVSRSGGTTLAELAAAGVPSILVPYPHATDDHQRRNARQAERSGAALIVDQALEPFAQRLSEVLGLLLSDADRRQRMALGMRRFARPEAAQQVAQTILRLCRRAIDPVPDFQPTTPQDVALRP